MKLTNTATDDQGAMFGADPSDGAYFHIFGALPESGMRAALFTVHFYVEIEVTYYAILGEPKDKFSTD